MSNEKIQPASMKKQLVVTFLVICTLIGVIAVWEKIFPPEMTVQCAYYIEKYPLEEFSFIQASSRDETMRCLFIKWKYDQKTLKLN